jgi:hypothetical protein
MDGGSVAEQPESSIIRVAAAAAHGRSACIDSASRLTFFSRLFSRLCAAVFVTSLAIPLVACAPAAQPQGPTMGLSTAKESTPNQQDELMSAVASDDVSSTVQSETSGALFECEAGGYYWPGT